MVIFAQINLSFLTTFTHSRIVNGPHKTAKTRVTNYLEIDFFGIRFGVFR